MWSSLGPTCLGFSVLPGLVCLFPSSNEGSFLLLFFQINFQFLALPLLLVVSLWLYWHFWSCPRVYLFSPRFVVIVVVGIARSPLYLPILPTKCVVGLPVLPVTSPPPRHCCHTTTSLPLLPICVNMASLNPWLSDFHMVWSSDSSGYFLFWA